MASRNASKLINFLGTGTSVKLVDGFRQNVFVGGKGDNTAPDASSLVLSTSVKNRSSVNIADYQMARTFLRKNGFDEKSAKTYGLIVADIAKINNISIYDVMNLVGDSVDFPVDQLAIVNLFRDTSSKQSKITDLDNTNSLKSRTILP